MTRLVRLVVEGPNARPGEIPAGDVARAILGLERALQRAADLIAPLRRRKGSTGRHTAEVERASRLRFVATRPGSLQTIMALPDDATALDDERLPMTVADLSLMALEKVLDAIEMDDGHIDRELASAIAQLGDELGVGDRTTAIAVERVHRPDGNPVRRAVMDATVRSRMKAASLDVGPTTRDDLLVGSLVEADFERYTARLRTGDRGVEVAFEPSMADEVQHALRQIHRFEGLVTYDPKTHAASSIALRAVVRASQSDLAGDDAFWRPRSFADLAREQGITGPPDLDAAVMTELTDEDRAELAEAVRGE